MRLPQTAASFTAHSNESTNQRNFLVLGHFFSLNLPWICITSLLVIVYLSPFLCEYTRNVTYVFSKRRCADWIDHADQKCRPIIVWSARNSRILAGVLRNAWSSEDSEHKLHRYLCDDGGIGEIP